MSNFEVKLDGSEKLENGKTAFHFTLIADCGGSVPVPPPVDKHNYFYTTASVLNVREGPGVDYSIIDAFNKGTEVDVLSYEGDWAKIVYGQGVAYVSRDYLEKSREPVSGLYGYMSIPDVNLSVRVFDTYDQKTVDAENSAAILTDMSVYGQLVIADHVHQGFSKMKSVKPGYSILNLEHDGKRSVYKCSKLFKGYNTGKDLTDLNGNSIDGMNDGGLCLYTCNSDGSITISLWTLI